jgi:hypothetical protein
MYNHHTYKVQKLYKEIKNYIKSNLLKKNTHEHSSFLSERLDTQESSVSKVRAKYKLNLSQHIQLENKKRKLMSYSIQKLTRKDALMEKVKSETEKKKITDTQKREAIQMRLKNILHEQKQKNQILNEKFSRISSRLGSTSPNYKKQMSINSYYSRNSVDNSMLNFDQLEDIKKKIEKSVNIHQGLLRQTSIRMADHNEKVDKTLKSQRSISEITQKTKLINLIEKIDDFDTRKARKIQDIQATNKKKLSKKSEKNLKIHLNLLEQEKNVTKKIHSLENKNIIHKNMLMSKLDELNKEKEYKLIKQRLRDEDNRENLERKKKNDLKKKEKLLEKHTELHKKFLQMKEEKEKANEKIRFDAIQASKEFIKAKQLQLLINRSKNPISVAKIIEKTYQP